VVYLERTPTRFGPVTLCLETHTDGLFTLDLALDPDWKHKPALVKVHMPASEVTLDGKKVSTMDGNWIDLSDTVKARLQGKWSW